MNTLIEQFRKELAQLALYADDTIATYISCVVRFVDFAAANFKIEPGKTSPAHLRHWITHLKNTGVSNSRISQHRAALNSFFTFLIKLQLLDKNPADGTFPIRKIRSSLNKPIDQKTAFTLLKSIDRTTWLGERNFMIISCLWALGLRRRELTDLKIKDFNRGYDPKNRIGLLIIHGKGKKQRALFVVDKLYDNLIAYLNHPQSPKQGYKPIFPTNHRKQISGDQVLKIVCQAAENAGITKRITPHVLRHSFATEMYLANVPLEQIQDMMGHENQAETSLYIHISDQLKRQALRHISIDAKFSWPFMQGGASRLSC